MAEVTKDRSRTRPDCVGDVARATECRVEPDECEREHDDAGADQRESAGSERETPQPDGKHGERRREHDEASTVCAGLAPADRDQCQRADREEPAHAADRRGGHDRR